MKTLFNYRDFADPESYIRAVVDEVIDEINAKVRICQNCGRFFILKGNYKSQYCDRLAPGSENTCQKVAAAKKYKAKIDSDPMMQAYQKAYNRLNFRMKNKKISALHFKAWQNTAKVMMTVANNDGEKQKEEVINWLNKC
jgi:cell fate (sporulation/competence/biofilm development) regulator YlbF (YheA/YmcA/DUF963 family)